MLNSLSEIKYAIKRANSLVLFLALFMVVSCNSSELYTKSNAQAAITPTVQDSKTSDVNGDLEQTVIRLTESYDNKNCKEFFDVFPNNFEHFSQIYGYQDGKGAGKLYSKYEEQIAYFFNCSEVDERKKLNKVIELGIGGKWEADAIERFQDSAFNLIKGHPKETNEILNILPDDMASSFWYFLFDGPHPTDKETIKRVKLLNNLLGKKSKQSKLLSEQYKKLVAE